MKLPGLSIQHELRAKHLAPRKRPVAGIVLHDSAGSGTHNDTRYLANPSDGRVVSADFTVERDGSIWQLNPDLARHATFHAGRATRFKALANRDVTRSTLGIQIVQKADLSLRPLYPPAQVAAVARLCAALCGAFGLSAADITTHAAVITDGSRVDPRSFDFDAFWLSFREALGQSDLAETALAMAKIAAPRARGEQSRSVVSGDTLARIARRFGTTVAELRRRNRLESDRVVIGQSLVVPAPAAAPGPAPRAALSTPTARGRRTRSVRPPSPS